jgi:hypothetical protein
MQYCTYQVVKEGTEVADTGGRGLPHFLKMGMWSGIRSGKKEEVPGDHEFQQKWLGLGREVIGIARFQTLRTDAVAELSVSVFL